MWQLIASLAVWRPSLLVCLERPLVGESLAAHLAVELNAFLGQVSVVLVDLQAVLREAQFSASVTLERLLVAMVLHVIVGIALAEPPFATVDVRIYHLVGPLHVLLQSPERFILLPAHMAMEEIHLSHRLLLLHSISGIAVSNCSPQPLSRLVIYRLCASLFPLLWFISRCPWFLVHILIVI